MPKLLAYTAIAIVVAVSAAFSAEEDPLKNFDVSIDCGALYKPPGKNILTVLRPVTVTLMPNNISITFEKGSDLVPGLTDVFGADVGALAMRKCLTPNG
jgi:hypothetical protein